MALLTPAELDTALLHAPAWSRTGQVIVRRFDFDSFADGIAFVNRLAVLADELWHHPDIDIRYKTVTVSLTTHDEGGLTSLDFTLAARIDAAAAEDVGR